MAARIPLNALQSAVYTRVNSLVSGATIYCPIAPNDATAPYIVLTTMGGTDASAKNATMTDCNYTLQVYTDVEQSFQSLNTLMNSISVAIVSNLLSLGDGFKEVLNDLTDFSVQSVQDDTGIMQQGTLVFRSLIEDTQ